MEIYRQRTNKVYFTAPADNVSVTAKVALEEDGVSYDVPNVVGNAASTTLRSIDIPYVENEGTVLVTWTYPGEKLTSEGYTSGNIEHVDRYRVVTPILSETDIKLIHPQATSEEVVKIEKAVRHIINSHTGQSFGKFSGDFRVKGNGSTLLQLPSRLLSFATINGSTETENYVVENEGWGLRFYPWGVPPVKADAYGYHMHVGGVIHNPNNVKLGTFSSDRNYEIGGTWGWEEVPAAVTEAAKLLVNDYACSDAQYRDRYLTSMTAADWRIQFNAGAFTRTGNVRADQLLSDYVLRRGWAVL